MKKTSKKLISLLLAVLMVLSSLTVGFVAFAADEEPEKTKVQLIEEEISAYYANHRSNLYLNDTDGKGDDAAEAEKKAAARKAFDELAAKVKALTEAEKLEMDLCTYVYWLTVVQEDVIRLASGNIYTSSSTAAKIELVTTKLGEIEAVTGNLPADYKAAVSAFMPYTVKVGSYSLTGSSFDYSQPEAQKALSDLIANLSKLSLAGLNFTDYLYVTTGGYYFSTSSISTTSKVGTTINNLIGYIEAKVKKTSGITVPSAPSAATFVQRKMIGIGNYDYVWRTYKVDGVDVEYTVKDVNDAFSEYAEKYAVDGVALDKAILDEALAAIKGMKALPGVADVIANYVAVAAEVKAAGGEIKDAKKVDDAVKAISAFEGDVLTIYDKIAANTKLSGMFLAGSPLDEKSSAEYVYNNAASLFERRALGGTRWYLFQAVEAIKVSALDEYVATVDMENITEDVVAKALELFLAIDGGERGKVSAETKTKLTTIFKPLGDGEDYADFVANFVKTPVDRDAIGGEVIWTAQGVQSAVDGLWSMVVNELGLHLAWLVLTFQKVSFLSLAEWLLLRTFQRLSLAYMQRFQKTSQILVWAQLLSALLFSFSACQKLLQMVCLKKNSQALLRSLQNAYLLMKIKKQA